VPKKRYNAEEIIHKLREANVLLSQGKTVSQACKQTSTGQLLNSTRGRERRWPSIAQQKY
jgi:hypothetical protein